MKKRVFELIRGGIIMTKRKKITSKGTGFAGPAIGGKPYPKGTIFRKNPDGTITPILPKSKKTDTDK